MNAALLQWKVEQQGVFITTIKNKLNQLYQIKISNNVNKIDFSNTLGEIWKFLIYVTAVDFTLFFDCFCKSTDCPTFYELHPKIVI